MGLNTDPDFLRMLWLILFDLFRILASSYIMLVVSLTNNLEENVLEFIAGSSVTTLIRTYHEPHEVPFFSSEQKKHM